MGVEFLGMVFEKMLSDINSVDVQFETYIFLIFSVKTYQDF